MESVRGKISGSLNREIIRLTVPTVLSNIAVPLLGLCDTAIAGHMHGEQYLASIAIGSVMMTAMYWLFSFLRAGTSGITANAFGASDKDAMGYSLIRSSLLGVVIGVIIISVHIPVLRLLQKFMAASPEVTELSGRYFSICINGAVPLMLLTALSGWLIGMQQTFSAMILNIGMSVVNVIATLCLVYVADMGFDGIAYGTLTAQWIILIPAIWIVIRICRKNGVILKVRAGVLMDGSGWKRMVAVNSNLFFRSACLIVLTLTLYAFSARLGNSEVSSNAVIQQLFLFFSYFMDGFAYTGEALVGRYYGAGDRKMLRKSIFGLLKWTFAMTAVFALIYYFGLRLIAGLLSDSYSVVEGVMECRLWVVLLPVSGALAFTYDGFYVGLTRTRPMLISTLCGVGLFLILINIVTHNLWMLWMSFCSYLSFRSALLVILFRINVDANNKISQL